MAVGLKHECLYFGLTTRVCDLVTLDFLPGASGARAAVPELEPPTASRDLNPVWIVGLQPGNVLRMNRARQPGTEQRFVPRGLLFRRHLGDAARSDDLVQTVLIAVLEALRAGRVGDVAKLDRYMLGVCRNAALTQHRAAARMSLAPTEQLPEIPAYDREVIDERALMNCLFKLEARARDVVMLSFSAERSPDEIAAALETSVANVRVMRHRAVAALRRCLDVSPVGSEAST